jgi:hypothetical protein
VPPRLRPDARPALILFVQTFGDPVNFNLHVLAAPQSCFDMRTSWNACLGGLPTTLSAFDFRGLRGRDTRHKPGRNSTTLI